MTDKNKKDKSKIGELLNIPEDTSSVLNLFLTQAIQYKNDQPKFPINEIKQMSSDSPELANQLFQMIQKELDRENERDNKIFELLNSQQQMAKQEFQEEIKITRYGQWFGFGVVVLLLVSSIVLTILDNPTAASIAIGATLVGIVGKFVRTN
ncbi:MAG: hypothetical protein OMM_09722 [Candidatus Magnetoglobus multicellularis str. Araruama]|uniref:DUF2335 domain-containing protein n=1 Tax=Candidatus Magnetoglobus multicellularis str. Araruama TaxID=890399 RepID=A0A1V1P336_9BACT|nr:MAG: hypothetical protein OMM_09722 [Candidatus Magnetoglobus multicellularis str. Araruama]